MEKIVRTETVNGVEIQMIDTMPGRVGARQRFVARVAGRPDFVLNGGSNPRIHDAIAWFDFENFCRACDESGF